MINDLITKHVELKAQMATLKKEFDNVKKELKLEMRAEELTDYQNDTTIVTFKEVVKHILDKEKVQTFMEDEDYQKCFKESTYDMLTVKLKKHQ